MQNENLIKSEEKENQTQIQTKSRGGIFSQIDLDTKREIAKIGMTASMGITVATSFYMKNKFMKNLHIGAGVALVGFSFWHHMLYQPDDKMKKLKFSPKTPQSDAESKVEIIEAKVAHKTENLAISLNNFYIELSIKGKLTDKELKLFEEKIEAILEIYDIPEINILLDIRETTGIEIKGLWDDLQFAMKHISQIKKVAVVGNKKFEEYTIKMADKLVDTKLSYYEEYDKAHEWLLS